MVQVKEWDSECNKKLNLCFLVAAITGDLVGFVKVFTCSLEQLATSPDLLVGLG